MKPPMKMVRIAALLLALLGLLGGLLAIALAHPRLGFGVWRDTEAVNAAIPIAATFCLLGASVHLAHRRRIDRLGAPVLACLLALGLWSALSAAFADYPMTALLGPPQSLYGAIWFPAQAGFVAAALVLLPHLRLFKLICTVMTALCVVVVWFNLRHAPGLDASALSALLPRHSLHSFNQYLGYHALAMLALAATAQYRGWRNGAIMLAAASIAILFVSGNRTAWGAAACAAFILPILWRWRRLPWQWWAWGTGSSIVVVAVILYAVIRLTDPTLLPPSLASRQIMFRALEHSLSITPATLLFGHGWGHFQLHLFANLPAAGINLATPDWIDFTRDEFHSHHLLLESLFAAGLPALLLQVLIPVAVVAGARPSLRPVAAALALALTMLDSLWFMMPENMVPIAMAWGALSSPAGFTKWIGRTPKLAALTLPLVLAVAMLGAGSALARDALAMEPLRQCLKKGRTPCPSIIPADLRQAQLGLATLIGETTTNLHRRNWPRKMRSRFSLVLAEAGERCRPTCSPALAWALSSSQFQMAYSPRASAIFSADLWHAAVLALTEHAPLRMDAVALYANWLLINGKRQTTTDLLAALPPRSRQSPVGLWFSGLVQLDSPGTMERERGLAMMRQALKDGLHRFTPIDTKTKATLESHR